MSLGPSNFGSNFINTMFSSLKRTHFRLVGAPTTIRRMLATNHPTSRKEITKQKLNCSVSIFRKEAVASTVTPPTPSFNGYPEYSRLLPCPSTNVPPRVEHLVVLEESPVCEYISKSLNLPPLYVADLIQFGAVYCALVCPDPPVTATPEQIQLYKQFTSPELLKRRHSIKGKTVREAQKTFRVTRIEEFFEVGTYLRVHVHPKRFPR